MLAIGKKTVIGSIFTNISSSQLSHMFSVATCGLIHFMAPVKSFFGDLTVVAVCSDDMLFTIWFSLGERRLSTD